MCCLWTVHYTYTNLKMSRSLNRKHQIHRTALPECSVQFALITWGGGPNSLLLGDLKISQVAALHYKVMHRYIWT